MKVFKLFYVYILKCADDSYYVGSTTNPDQRLQRHEDGYYPNSYTFSRRPVELVYIESYWDFHEGIKREKQIKGWSRRKKEALIVSNYTRLKEYSACKNETSHTLYKK